MSHAQAVGYPGVDTSEMGKRFGELLGLSHPELLRLVLALEKQVMTDMLTGLKTRGYVTDHLKHLSNAMTRAKTPFAVLFVDIDHFKKVNDTLGHDAGDMVLKAVARALQDHVRPLDVVARWGGEEILISMPETAEEGALASAERLRAAVEALSFDEHPDLRVTVSIGVATTEDVRGSRGMEGIVNAADMALYTAKNKGRNQVATFAQMVQASCAIE